jgi:hypothetical protein
MKNQNPQEILNEILLLMKYDSSKTLSENKKIILEQGGNYYTPSGQLIGYPGVNSVNIPASDVYPEIKNNKYPQQADFGKMQTAFAGRNIRKSFQNFKPQTPSFQRPNIPQSDVLGPQGSFIKQLGVDRASMELRAKAKEKERKELEQAKLNAQYEKEYQKELSILKKKYKQESMISPQNYVTTNKDAGVTDKELGDYIESYNIYKAESVRLRPEYLKAKELLDKKYFKTKLNNFVSYDDGFNLPEKAKASFFTKEDFHSVESIRNAFHTKLSDDVLKRFITEESTGPVITTPNYQFKSGDLFSWIWNKVKGKVKDFKLPEPYDIYVFNKNLYINNQGYFDVSKNYYFKNGEGKLIPYNENDYRNSTFWENNGATLLNLGSLVIAVLFPATWPYLLASATLDLAAAKIQYEQGETEGAKMSVLLSLTPFIPKLALKVPSIMTKNLINKFKGAVTADDVSKVVLKLSQEELKALGALKEYGDLNKLKREINYVEANNAIKKVAKQAPSLVPALKKASIELSIVGVTFKSMISNVIGEIKNNNLTRLETINSYLKTITNNVNLDAFPSLTEEDKKELKTTISETIPINEIIEMVKKKQEAIQKMNLDISTKNLNEQLIWLESETKATDADIKILSDSLNNVTEINKSIVDDKQNPNEKLSNEEKIKLK